MNRRSDWLIGQLPMGMLDDEFFVRFVSLFQDVASSLLEGADNITNLVDRSVAPPELVRYLGSWLAVSWIDASLPDDLQRDLVRQAGHVLSWRGTRRGLEGFLESLTGAPAEVRESGSIVRDIDIAEDTTFVRSVDITVSSLGWLPESDFISLVADEIPANVSFSLSLGDRQLWPTAQLDATGTEGQGSVS